MSPKRRARKVMSRKKLVVDKVDKPVDREMGRG